MSDVSDSHSNPSSETATGKGYRGTRCTMHMVTYSSRYANFSSAHVASGGMAVIGVFFKLTTDQSKSILISSFNPKVLLPTDKHHFFRYQGSLTTPPCTETVQWTVMRNPLYVTSAEVDIPPVSQLPVIKFCSRMPVLQCERGLWILFCSTQEQRVL
ncbi:unnamed protein product [Schistocephalus solidus]|uniref:carbonic anhydrase n=1 Tax=Schistocephalus solidus TaxID=70667 RepID=A0A3P7D8G3_SCHSO|nr:unnamed protein product [Schistocephalus solidus]